jgi:hypothetical protein
VAHTAWVRRAAAHPLIAQALAEGKISESFARTICKWTDRLPEDCRAVADEILISAAKTGTRTKPRSSEATARRPALGEAQCLPPHCHPMPRGSALAVLPAGSFGR